MTRAVTSIVMLALAVTSAAQTSTTSKHEKTDRIVECHSHDWHDEEVDWIITPQERANYSQLKNDRDREEYIDDFWLRRDPSPDTYINELRNEHYRRILHANEHFSAKNLAGSRSDRGRIYIRYGAPESVVEAQSDSPQVIWKYRWIDDYTGFTPALANTPGPIELRFVDVCHCGNYVLQMADDEKHILLEQSNEFPEVIETIHGRGRIWPRKPPVARFKELEAYADNNVIRTDVPFQLEMKMTRVTKLTHFVPITLTFENSELKWTDYHLNSYADVQIYIRWTNASGRVSNIVEWQLRPERSELPPVVDSQSVATIPFYLSSGITGSTSW